MSATPRMPCKSRVNHPGTFTRDFPCPNFALPGRDNCAVHDPRRRAAKRKEKEEKFNAESAARKRDHSAIRSHGAALALADAVLAFPDWGHGPPTQEEWEELVAAARKFKKLAGEKEK